MAITKLNDDIYDEELIDFFYLNYGSPESIADYLMSLKFELFADNSKVPFNAQLRDYIGAVDSDDNFWIVKKLEDHEIIFHRICEFCYYFDCELQTLAAPTIMTKINNSYFRATKVVLQATQISGYDYLVNPYKKILANDLINRWLFCDEDRNPNNYLVIHNSKGNPLVVVIDYNKVDLETKTLKIKGNESKFGWLRKEKTRFLTLLKPENFEGLYIDDFSKRLELMMNFSEERIKKLCLKLFSDISKSPGEIANLITSNILKRRNYLNQYFRKWFKPKADSPQDNKSEYEGFGKSFLKYYNKDD